MSVNIKKLKHKEAGYSIVELTIVFSLIGVLSAAFFISFNSLLTTLTRTNYMTEMTNVSQNLLRTMVEELRYGAGVRQTNSITDPNGPAGGWNTNNDNFVIITAVPALNTSNEYIINPDTGSPYLNEYVYYKLDNLLFKRTLANPSASGNRSKTSCPPASSTSTCPADRQLAETLSSMSFILYDQDNTVTTTAAQARSIKINLTLHRDTFGNPLVFDNSIRTTLRNTF